VVLDRRLGVFSHFRATMHPLIQSFQPGENWIYCYVDDLLMVP
jgi:hypothetical protein